ncbi:HNH endonuclease [Candidatus Pacearchaeota archaeon]|jgi:purine nucleoside permease|nr:HNH endonuclease [Candidatus Pacearchaeota archaeon]
MSTLRNDRWTGMNWVRQTTRLAIYLRDGLACIYCGATVEDGATLTLDHITPVSRGGKNHHGNLGTCCHRCNSSRGTRSIAAFSRAVAAYLDHGATAAEIVRHVRATVRRQLPREEARNLIARRGSVARVLASGSGR